MSIDKSNWMRDQAHLHSRKLSEITVPGTHHANAVTLTDLMAPGASKALEDIYQALGGDPFKLVGRTITEEDKLDPLLPVSQKPLPDNFVKIIKGWSIPQHHPVLTQLQHGARYLDMRVLAARLEGKVDFYSHHQLLGGKISIFLDQVAEFMCSVTGEVVFIEAAHMNFQFCLHQRLIRMIRAKLGDYLFHGSDEKRPLCDYTLGELTADGPKVVLLYDNADFGRYMTANPHEFPDVWQFGHEVEDIYDGDSYETVKGLATYTRKHVKPSVPNKLVKLQWLMTPKTEDFVTHVGDTLDTFSGGSVDMLPPFIHETMADQINVIFVDFFVNESHAFELAMQRNR